MKKGFILTSIGALFWGFSGVCGQYLFNNYHFSSLYLTAIRMLVAGVLLMIISIVNYRGDIIEILKNDKVGILIFAIFGLSFSQFTYLTAISYSNAPTATVLQYLYPIVIIFLTCLKKQRLPYKIELLCIILALTGVFILATGGNINQMVLSYKGLIWGILAAIGAVSYTLTPVKLMNKHGSLPVVALGMLIGGIVIFFSGQVYKININLDYKGYMALIGICVIGTAFAYSMYLYGVKEIGALKASILASLEPISATLFSIILLNASFKFTDIIGFSLIMFTVILLAIKKESLN